MEKDDFSKRIKSVFDSWVFPEKGDTIKYRRASSTKWIDKGRVVEGIYNMNTCIVKFKLYEDYDGATFNAMKCNDSRYEFWSSDNYTRLILLEKALNFDYNE